MKWVGKGPGRVYRWGKRAAYRIPGVPWLFAWTDPLHLARRLLRQAVEARAHCARGRLLDVGCGGKPYHDLFQHVEEYVGMDITPNGRVDVLGDAMSLPFRGQVFDTLLCNEVLEHVPEPLMLMKEAARVLKPGGYLILTTPQTWGLHHEPHDFYRYTPYGLQYLAQKSGVEVIEIIPTCGLWATLAQRITDTAVYTYAVNWPSWAVRGLSVLLSPVQLTGFVVDKVAGKRGDTLDHLLVARKPEERRG